MTARQWFYGITVPFILLVLTSCLFDALLIQTVFFLALGWAWHTTRVLPAMTVNWGGVAMMLIATGLAAAIGHGCVKWLWRGLGYGTPWRAKWTLTGLAAVMLMFVAGTSATGVVHQTGWLISGRDPIIKQGGRSRETAYRVKCASNLRQIGHIVAQYASANDGRRPASLRALLEAAAGMRAGTELFVCLSTADEKALGPTTREWIEQVAGGKPHLSYVYVPEGIQTPAGEVVMYDPFDNHSMDGGNALFADGHVEFVNKAFYERHLLNPAPATTRSSID